MNVLKLGDRVRIVKKNYSLSGLVGSIRDVIDRGEAGRFVEILIRDFGKDGSAIAPKLREDEVELVLL